MGIVSMIVDSFRSADQGENWAVEIWNHNTAVEEGEKDGDIIEPDQNFVEELGEEYSKSPADFYAGFSQQWNDMVKEEAREQSSFGRFLNWAGF